jgi:hypothetical protein
VWFGELFLELTEGLVFREPTREILFAQAAISNAQNDVKERFVRRDNFVSVHGEEKTENGKRGPLVPVDEWVVFGYPEQISGSELGEIVGAFVSRNVNRPGESRLQ